MERCQEGRLMLLKACLCEVMFCCAISRDTLRPYVFQPTVTAPSRDRAFISFLYLIFLRSFSNLNRSLISSIFWPYLLC